MDGGSFNPLHNEHITRLIGILKSSGFNLLGIDSLMILPSGSGGRKDKMIHIDPTLRLEMAEFLARAVQPHAKIPISVNPIDIFRSPNTPTYYLWKELLGQKFGRKLESKSEYQSIRFCFILGSDWQPDSIRSQWVRGGRLVDPNTGCDFIITHREGYPRTYDASDYPNFHWVEYAPDYQPKMLSSSEIRLKIKQGVDISQDVPIFIKKLIEKHRLYQEAQFPIA